YWDFQFSLNWVGGYFNDRIYLTGTAQHVKPVPGHPDSDTGGQYSFDHFITAKDQGGIVGKLLTDPQHADKPHPPHTDVYESNLSGQLAGIWGHDIDPWKFTLTGNHVSGAGAVPEPSTLLIGSTSVVLCLVYAWCRRWTRKDR